MNEKTVKILKHFDLDDKETIALRNWFVSLDKIPDSSALIQKLTDAIARINLGDHDRIWFYHVLLGCIQYEQSEYSPACHAFRSAIQELWDSPLNMVLTNWLLSLSLSQDGDYPMARQELQKALHILHDMPLRLSPHSEKENQTYLSLKEEISKEMTWMSFNPLFRSGQSEQKTKTKSRADPFERRHQAVHSAQTPPPPWGYMVLMSQPIYNQSARAGGSGAIELTSLPEQYAEVHEIVINGDRYRLCPVRAKSRIAPSLSAKVGWMKVEGESMKSAEPVHIEDGDYLLVQMANSADEHDIVVASREDRASGNRLVMVKRLKKRDGVLVSETPEKGSEFDPISIADEKVLIHGVVYAVAKPLSPHIPH